MINTIVTLHSGAHGLVPNSQEYLDLAARVKPDVVEVDVRSTSGGIAVLHHDPFVCQDGAEYAIEDSSWEKLSTLKPGLITLTEAMKFCHKNHLFMNLDLKTPRAADSVVKVVKKQKMTKEILFSGCRRDDILYLREQIPNIRILLNIDDHELDLDGDDYMDAVVQFVYLASELGCCGLNINYSYCRPELISYARTRSMPLMLWTIDHEAEMRRFLSLGVYSITTNRIDLFHKLQSEMNT
ncbi:MAG: hypothetical protein B6241_12000 [Spirochaetaceae bacterium 4572_59]|nr:MAG: hypothetical protein B6241_12000 [Spirochaetaceae bacterium 4572_59]